MELASRDLDSSPFSAGADIVRDAGGGYIGFCTTSFAFTSSGQERLFTADHCGNTGQVWRTGRNLANATVGTMTAPAQNVPRRDIATISGGDYGARVYTGPNSSSTTIAVAGYTAPVVNQILCYSGAPSGTVCNNRVTHTGLTINYGPGSVHDGITRTVQQNGTPAVGSGDSGGPVYAPTSDGRATAVGVISGISGGGSACTGDPSSAQPFVQRHRAVRAGERVLQGEPERPDPHHELIPRAGRRTGRPARHHRDRPGPRQWSGAVLVVGRASWRDGRRGRMDAVRSMSRTRSARRAGTSADAAGISRHLARARL